MKIGKPVETKGDETMTFEERVQQLRNLQQLRNDPTVDQEALEDHIDCEAMNLLFTDEDIDEIFDGEPCNSSSSNGEPTNSDKENKDQ